MIHRNLADWIARNGGIVHPNLALLLPPNNSTKIADSPCGKFARRGIFAKHGPIAQGEVLIRLPSSLALTGSDLPACYEYHPPVETMDSTTANDVVSGYLDGDSSSPSFGETIQKQFMSGEAC